MKNLFLASFLIVVAAGCAQVRYAETGLGQAIDNPVTQTYDWGEVHCGRGTICAEVEVLRVDMENTENGKVEVTLHNRTDHQSGLQIAVEIRADNGTRLDSTPYQNVAVEPRGETVFDFPGIYQPGAKVRVLLRALAQN
ncbi:MAG: hypothetical protein CMH56_10470 [Myxococcales bacterium]|nr:hypothetical protein [Myxococcales bacterium]|tara:strand:+ start:1333 stop:1749 length:417 start_codon:yes stop_codon:yes gene_type:complete